MAKSVLIIGGSDEQFDAAMDRLRTRGWIAPDADAFTLT